MRLLTVGLSVLSVMLLPTNILFAQSAKKSTSKLNNVKVGTVQSIDSVAATIVVHPKSGPDLAYRYTDKTMIRKAKRIVEISAFKVGDDVTVRFRKSAVGPSTLYDLTDAASWTWLTRIRHETVKATVKEISVDDLTVFEGDDKAEIEYRVTEKTTWGRDGKPVTFADFKAGDIVFIAPRMLPGGTIMATAITGDAQSIKAAKERTKSTISAVIKTVNMEKKTVAFRTSGGDDRELHLMDDCTVRQSSKDVPLAYLKPFMNVTLHLAKVDEGTQEIKAITIISKKAGRKPSTLKPIAVPKP